jgi:hypothetical protein
VEAQSLSGGLRRVLLREEGREWFFALSFQSCTEFLAFLLFELIVLCGEVGDEMERMGD